MCSHPTPLFSFRQVVHNPQNLDEMPNRKYRKDVAPSIRKRLWAMPCAICGRKDDIEVDHIHAVCDGGGADELNLQPLCRVCNVLKRRWKTNDSVKAWIEQNYEQFLIRQNRRTVRKEALLRGEWF